MGLNMYLCAVWSREEYTFTKEVIYWRKTNAVHKWFVDNCQDGVDNCAIYELSRESLLELRKICQEVLDDNSKAKELLPTQSGFFFGSLEYDKYYFGDLEYTVKKIDEVLKDETIDYFQYQSSW